MGQNKIILKKDGLSAVFLKNGDLYQLCKNEIMINQLNGNNLDGSVNQIYLRILEKGQIFAVPLIGSNSKSEFWYDQKQLSWSGSYAGVIYQVDFVIASANTWFWRVNLSGSGQRADLLFGQDLGIAAKAMIKANEAYVSQYIDHHITTDSHGYVISSRQNQQQSGCNPAVEHGCLNRTTGFSTDGYQFFGNDYKKYDKPRALCQSKLDNEVYQYEFAYSALQTDLLDLHENQMETIVFYGMVCDDHPKAVEAPIGKRSEVLSLFEQICFAKPGQGRHINKQIGEVLTGLSLNDTELEQLFSKRVQVERDNDTILSFFTDHYHHVVLKEKEYRMERSHGQIILSGTDLIVDRPLMSSTLYMSGIFNSQIALGNTSMNKLLSNSRNALNVQKLSGQRIYLKAQDEWQLLTMPSAFEIALNSATWYYKLVDDMLTITTYCLSDAREIRTEISSQSGRLYDFAITNHIIMNAEDESPEYEMTEEQDYIKITAAGKSSIAKKYPDLTYYFKPDVPYQLKSENMFGVDTEVPELMVLLIEKQPKVTVRIQGSITGEAFKEYSTSHFKEDSAYVKHIDDLLNGLELEHPVQPVGHINILTRWYTQNMLVHYLSPHGLEQYGGAAWGTRDVSQGPAEFFMAVNRPDIVRSIIKVVYANQFFDDGNWPQWFMFDHYEEERADESHGDIIVWPLKMAADYLEKTGDDQILYEQIAYTDRDTYHKTELSESLFEHMKKQISYIEDNFLPGTCLSCYGDGDWDDTLQPYDPNMKKNMASSWTVALTYQTVIKLGQVLKESGNSYGGYLIGLAAKIKGDFRRYMLATGTLPGFVYRESEDKLQLMIHPQDRKSGIKYRLLPMTRSIIAELLTEEEARHHYKIIKDHLEYPDGVRLMSRPAEYHGGVCTYFKRAEQAANFGREVGLNYIHADIRYAEAMAKMGIGEAAWRTMENINPIQIRHRVPGAMLRQANAYFSSSDGNFKTRYEADQKFEQLKDGTIGVKGGWRIYSSGPGIYLNQLISNLLGIRVNVDSVIFDPILPDALSGLTIHYRIFSQKVKIVIHSDRQKRKIVIAGKEVPFLEQVYAYRSGGMILNREVLEQCLDSSDIIEIYC